MRFILSAFVLISIALLSCKSEKETDLSIAPGDLDVQVEGNCLVGPSALNDPNKFVWGGSVLKGDDGRYHMIYSTWKAGDSLPPFVDTWLLYSELAYATSDYPDRDFKFEKVVVRGRMYDGDSTAWDAQTAHNPHLKRYNGRYYLYYAAGMDPLVLDPGMDTMGVRKRDRIQRNQKIGLIEFDTFEDLMAGNYTRSREPLLSPRTKIMNKEDADKAKPDNMIVVNPSVCYDPKTKNYLLYFKGNLYNPNWRGVHGVAESKSPSGPFIPRDEFVFDVREEDGSIASGEDPYVWYNEHDKKFYSVLKDFTGKITGSKKGLAILESLDGLTWTKPEEALFMPLEVTLLSGEKVEMTHLERPQFLLDDNGKPIAMYAAASIVPLGKNTSGDSFNLQFPIVKKTKTSEEK